MTANRRASDHMTTREKWANVGLVVGIILCIGAAVGLKLTSKDSTVVDVFAGVFMLIAVFCAIPVQFRKFIGAVGPYIPVLGAGSAAQRAVTATDDAAVASRKAATAVRAAVEDAGEPR